MRNLQCLIIQFLNDTKRVVRCVSAIVVGMVHFCSVPRHECLAFVAHYLLAYITYVELVNAKVVFAPVAFFVRADLAFVHFFSSVYICL